MRDALLASLPTWFDARKPMCFIVGAGDFSGMQILPKAGDLVIAADGGYAHLKAAGIACDLLMGDFDSLDEEIEVDAKTQRFSPIKDDTDTMLSVKYGLAHGYNRFVLYGVFGGRFDHTVGMLQTVAYLLSHGASVLAFEGDASGSMPCRSYVTGVKNGTLSFPDTAKGYLSLFAFGGVARGVTLENLAYEMQNGALYPDVALGVSNAFREGNSAKVTVEDGMLLAVKPFS